MMPTIGREVIGELADDQSGKKAHIRVALT